MIAGTSSTSDIAGAGLKKWMPQTRSGRSVTIAISTTGSVDVLVARIADGVHTRSRSRKRSCLVARSSTIDSSTRSHAASSSSAVTAPPGRAPRRRWRRRCGPSSPAGRATRRGRRASRRRRPGDRLRSTTSKPAAAATSATPAPMIPEPTTPMRLIAIARSLSATAPLSREAARLPAGNLRAVIARPGRSRPARVAGPGLVSAPDGSPPRHRFARPGRAAGSGARALASSTPSSWPAAGPTRCSCCPTAAAYEHPERVGERAEAYFGALGAKVRGRCRCSTAARPRTPRSPRRCARRSSCTSPTARRCTCARCSRTRRCSTRCSRRTTAAGWSPRPAPAPRCCATRWSIRAAARTPSGSAWCRTSRSSRTTAPRPTHLRERSIDLLPRAAVLAGVDEETALVKAPDGWSVAGAGTVTLYGGWRRHDLRRGRHARGPARLAALEVRAEAD